MDEREQKAIELHQNGYNCAQTFYAVTKKLWQLTKKYYFASPKEWEEACRIRRDL